jgi:hypothetical protein
VWAEDAFSRNQAVGGFFEVETHKKQEQSSTVDLRRNGERQTYSLSGEKKK